METDEQHRLFRQVVIVTPDRRAHGGIASVTAAYSRCFPGLAFVETNSRRGTVVGALRLALALAQLPLLRLCGRKLLHVHAAAGKSFHRKKIVVKWGRMLGYKVIYHNHSGLITDTVRACGKNAVKAVLDRCSRVIVLSKVWEDYFRNTLGCTDVDILNNIVEIPENIPERQSDSCVEFLFMGLLMERKGIFDLLEAVKPLAEQYPGRFRLVVGGAHGEEERFRHIIASDALRGCVKYVGWLDKAGKESCLATADAIVLPSYAEGVPITILEGFARGIPAIASAVGGIPDMMDNGVEGLLVEAGNIEQLTEALRSYIVDGNMRRRHGLAARRRVADYSPQAVGNTLASIYRRVL